MPVTLPKTRPTRMSRTTYRQDFSRRLAAGPCSIERIERGQQFREPGVASWEAFARGEWEHALALAADQRPAYSAQAADRSDRGITERRLRVVEFPVTPYVQWEMHVLRLKAAAGFPIKVLDARAIQHYETRQPLPELVIMGDAVIYDVRYAADGTPVGCLRYTEPELIPTIRRQFTALYEQAEDIHPFFARVIAPLPPPRQTS